MSKLDDDTQKKNSKWKLCGDIDKTVDHIISECINLVQKEYMGGKVDPLGIVQNIKIWLFWQMIYVHQPEMS